MTQEDILKACRIHLYNPHQRSGRIDLTKPSHHAYISFEEMYRNHHRWRTWHTPFSSFSDRCTWRVLRSLGSDIRITLVEPMSDRPVMIQSQEELEGAIKDGFVYIPGKPHEMSNPCAEILLGRFDSTVMFNRPVDPVRGSPFQPLLIPEQLRLAMRHIYRFLHPGNKWMPVIEALPYVHLNRKGALRLIHLMPPKFVNELIYSFYSENRQPEWWRELRHIRDAFHTPDSTELMAQFVAKAIYDAMPKGTKDKDTNVFLNEWKTNDVMGIIEEIHKNEDFTAMPILADALMDAGCFNEELLVHLRNNQAEFTLGSWVFRCCGRLK